MAGRRRKKRGGRFLRLCLLILIGWAVLTRVGSKEDAKPSVENETAQEPELPFALSADGAESAWDEEDASYGEGTDLQPAEELSSGDAAEEQAASPPALEELPPYSGKPYTDINGDVPYFTETEMTTEAFDEYGPLDELGRCTAAYACVGPETMPTEDREDIREVHPTGWNGAEYEDIDGKKLFNRCHLIGFQLTGQNANERNLITGTRYLNIEGMLPFENSVASYVRGTGHHVMYRVTPYFEGSNMVAAGVLMEARSVEDPLVQYCAFCYNVQPGVVIDYATGENDGPSKITAESGTGTRALPATGGEPEAERVEDEIVLDEYVTEVSEGTDYVLNTNTKKFHYPYCASVSDMKEKNRRDFHGSREEVIAEGYVPCKRCNP